MSNAVHRFHKNTHFVGRSLQWLAVGLICAFLWACGGGGGGSGSAGSNDPSNMGNQTGGGQNNEPHPSPDANATSAPTSLTYNSNTIALYQHSVLQPSDPTVSGGTPTQYFVSPALPLGINIDNLTGRISGTPMVTQATSNFVITASNPAGSTTAALSLSVSPPGNRVLMFVAYNEVWWAEYKVMYEALTAAGYQVDVRSSEPGGFSQSYQSDGDIQASADSQLGGSYSAFTATFSAQFGGSWSNTWNTPSNIPINGAIQDVQTMAPYVALVIPGGLGAQAYYLDGSYEASMGAGGHNSSASNVQAAAQRINALVIEALQSSKPVLAQCHGAPLLAHVRVAGTAGEGPGGLGRSILQGRTATGYHLIDGNTASLYSTLDISYLAARSVVIDSASSTNLSGSKAGFGKLITTRDWYPQTVMHATSSLISVLRSHPRHFELAKTRKVLILHGGLVNPVACGVSDFATNDVPCNWPGHLPADYSHLLNLLSANSDNDPFNMQVSHINLMGTPPVGFDTSNASAINNYLIQNGFEAVVYFKHWSHSGTSGVTDALQQGLLQFADEGGGLVALHHGLFNSGGIDILAAAFEAQANTAGWLGLTDPWSYSPVFMNVNHGHFVSSFSVQYGATQVTPGAGFPLTPLPNASVSGLPALTLADELYLNMSFTGAPVFGAQQNQINLLLANNHVSYPNQTLTAGFSKLYNPNLDAKIGRLVYLQPGENSDNYTTGSAYGQMIRNAVIWSAIK